MHCVYIVAMRSKFSASARRKALRTGWWRTRGMRNGGTVRRRLPSSFQRSYRPIFKTTTPCFPHQYHHHHHHHHSSTSWLLQDSPWPERLPDRRLRPQRRTRRRQAARLSGNKGISRAMWLPETDPAHLYYPELRYVVRQDRRLDNNGLRSTGPSVMWETLA